MSRAGDELSDGRELLCKSHYQAVWFHLYRFCDALVAPRPLQGTGTTGGPTEGSACQTLKWETIVLIFSYLYLQKPHQNISSIQPKHWSCESFSAEKMAVFFEQVLQREMDALQANCHIGRVRTKESVDVSSSLKIKVRHMPGVQTVYVSWEIFYRIEPLSVQS